MDYIENNLVIVNDDEGKEEAEEGNMGDTRT